ncbi:RsmB/NOP family class I SAM-dependent RNA methyltransferase [Tropicibacter sp. R16_0]|uniref:RsmB/NOP family class I SAM-dependent RNA methyltransferase n=1 Tax=Tropicibacter sp. R16_0 TaxID=2821102 RepID=UPI001AD97D23|nr:RsmB/NOP family class I SAM-dependent RNA methyltransferase [Tropicibacter sp. R16_0]MBO9449561.1 RsmB/NOP family class I SAM-dependent RNA methyltransferase [Tropicibacter sp. R16_0]
MTPAARVQTAITILDEIGAGAPVEKALTGWARRSRYAGSKDRAAVRDHVFDVIRQRRSLAALGGGESGRHLMIGLCRRTGVVPDEMFNGAPHAPVELTDAERAGGRVPIEGSEAADLPNWLWPEFSASLGDKAAKAAEIMQTRAPVHLRVNVARTSREGAIEKLAAEGIDCIAHPVASTALEVIEGARRVHQSDAYKSGLIELQDAASQAVVESLPLEPGMRVLDYCAGGGGKALALAAHAGVDVFAHDIAPQRMRDLPERASRAKAKVTVLTPSELGNAGKFDLVLADAPCSGSGSWRRAPAGKWQLTPARLEDLLETQLHVIETASQFAVADGAFAYATCSSLNVENSGRVDAFLDGNSGWALKSSQAWTVLDGADGFFVALLSRVL